MPLDEAADLSVEQAVDITAIDEALKSLSAIDPRKSRIVELKFFGGLSIDETAEVMSLSTATVEREWRSAKAWLYRRLAMRDRDDATE